MRELCAVDASEGSSVSCQPGKYSLCAWQGEAAGCWVRGGGHEGGLGAVPRGVVGCALRAEESMKGFCCCVRAGKGEGSPERPKGIQGCVWGVEFGMPVPGKAWTASQRSSPWGSQEVWEGRGEYRRSQGNTVLKRLL